jgi:hypothetical protein
VPSSPAQSQPLQAVPPLPLGPELERRAAEVRRQMAERAKFIAEHEESTTFRLALTRPCADHHAAAGKPCWRMPLDDKHHRSGRGVCGGNRAYTTSAVVVVSDGCAICGVAHQLAPAATTAREGLANVARDLWKAMRTGTSQLGWPSPWEISGHLCTTWAEACSSTHAMGPSALEKALVKALAPEKEGFQPYGHLSVHGLIGWGAISAQAQLTGDPVPKPNTRPFEHLDGLAKLQVELSRALGD